MRHSLGILESRSARFLDAMSCHGSFGETLSILKEFDEEGRARPDIDVLGFDIRLP